MFSARLTTDKTRWELITGQLDPNKQWSREQSLHPFFNHDASGDIFAGIDFTADACCSTDNGDRWTVIHNALTTSNVTNALTVSWNRAVFAGTYGDGAFPSTDRGQLAQASTLFSFFSFAAKPSGDIFVGMHFGSGFLRSTDDSDTWCREKQWVDSDGRFGQSRLTRSELSLPEQQDAGQASIALLTTATVGRLPT